MFSFTRTWIRMLLVITAGGWTALPTFAQAGAPPTTPPPITTIPSDGFNMKVVEQPTPYYVITTLDPPVFNWFAGTFTNLPTDKEVTIGLNMNAMDHTINNADVSKWVGLKTVMTYTDPNRLEAYEWFEKDEQGRWVSGDSYKIGDNKYAGTGQTPIQSMIPERFAIQFLSPDGKYWQPWREVDSAESVASLNIFRIKQHFDLPTATIAMRIPFTYTVQRQVISHLNKAYPKRVQCHSIGHTPQGRDLIILEVNPKRIDKSNPTVLLLAREHATEQDASWVTKGVLDYTLTHPELDNITWLVIPLYDPDGASNSTFDSLTNRWSDNPTPVPTEVYTYARWLVDRYNLGRTIDLAVSLHNIECTEGTHIESPTIRSNQREFGLAFNTRIFKHLSDEGYLVGRHEPWEYSLSNFRMHGWCALRLHALNLAFEINSRYPTKQLNLKRTEMIGYILADEIGKFINSQEGKINHDILLDYLRQHILEHEHWLRETAATHGQSELYNLFINAF